MITRESDPSEMKVWVIPPVRSPGTAKVIAESERNVKGQWRKETMSSSYHSEISGSI